MCTEAGRKRPPPVVEERGGGARRYLLLRRMQARGKGTDGFYRCNKRVGGGVGGDRERTRAFSRPSLHTHSHLTNSRYGRWQQMVCRYFFWSNPTTKRPIGEKRWVSLRLLLLLSLGKTDQSSGPGEWHTFFILVDRITPPSSALLSGQIFPCLTSLPEKRALFSWSLLAQ